MSINKKRVWQWCRENNWTEPRRISTGDWVAFPPGGSIEMPLPSDLSLLPKSSSNSLFDALSPLVLIVSGLAVAIISVTISPLFLAAVIRRYRQHRSMSI